MYMLKNRSKELMIAECFGTPAYLFDPCLYMQLAPDGKDKICVC